MSFQTAVREPALDKTIGDFVTALRKADLEVSPAETLEAIRAINIIGLQNRELLRNSLSMILAKSAEEKVAYQQCFERFFSPDELTGFLAWQSPVAPVGSHINRRGPVGAATDSTDTQPMTGEGANDVSKFGVSEAKGSEADHVSRVADRRRMLSRTDNMHDRVILGAMARSRIADLVLNGREDNLSVLVHRAAVEVKLEKMKSLRERALYIRRILLHMGMKQLDAEIEQLEKSHSPEETAALGLLTKVKDYVSEKVSHYVENQYFLLVDGKGDAFIQRAVSNTKLTNMQHYYFDHIREAVRKLANQLAKKHSKKRKLTNRGQLDLRRTLRRNLAYDGTLFEVKWRQVRRQRPDVFVICDVSGSVRNVARFLLTFLYSLSEVLPKVRSFAFSNDFGEVTDLFNQFSLEQAIEMSLDDYGKGSTDYGMAFTRFRDLCLPDINSRSTIIVLGDSRNNYFAPHAQALKKVSNRARQVIWLNPEPREKWREGDADMQAYLPHVDVAEVCNSLRDLERMVGKILQTGR